MYVLELNDSALRLSRNVELLAAAPGFALLERNTLALGDAARQRARLAPRQTNTQFWSRLSLDTLAQPGTRARTHADLAYAQLLDLWDQAGGSGDDDAGLIFAVPGSFDRQQMALLLGVARECPFRAAGLVDLAVAAAASCEQINTTHLLHVDVHLHRALLTLLEVSDQIVRTRVEEVPAAALTGLQDAMVGLIADEFIRETRFDPLHEAQTEQRLYDALPEWLQALAARGETLLELDTQRSSFRITLHEDQLHQRLAPRYQQLLERLQVMLQDAPDTQLLLSAGARALPGLSKLLETRLGLPMAQLPPDAVAQGVNRHQERIARDGEQLAFVTRLPAPALQAPAKVSSVPADEVPDSDHSTATEPPPAPVPTAPAQAPRQTGAPAAEASATHLLVGHQALPLTSTAYLLDAHGALVETPETAVCRIRAQGHGCRLDPLQDDVISYLDKQVAAPLYLEPGEEILLRGRIRVAPIIVVAAPASLAQTQRSQGVR